MNYRGFNIERITGKMYSVSIRNKNGKLIIIESENLLYIKRQIDDVVDFKTLNHKISDNVKNSLFWKKIQK
nr:hypothetical protein BEI47_18940 [Aliivibrio fischeri]